VGQEVKGPETNRSDKYRTESGFYERYMQGVGLDIGYKGSLRVAETVLPTAIGIEPDYPGYDGLHLPFESASQNYVFASHVLEHVDTPVEHIAEWFRVLKVSGHLIICVPHRDLYEKKLSLPSKYNRDHRRFYLPSNLLNEVEQALPINAWRIEALRDNDDGYNYSIPPEKHCAGACEIELVIQKIEKPQWELK
jgi:SAM-dependent methyltransferase